MEARAGGGGRGLPDRTHAVFQHGGGDSALLLLASPNSPGGAHSELDAAQYCLGNICLLPFIFPNAPGYHVGLHSSGVHCVSQTRAAEVNPGTHPTSLVTKAHSRVLSEG